jgi:hypothetical protein
VLSNHLRSLVVEEGGRDVGLIHNQVFKKIVFGCWETKYLKVLT